MNLSALAPGLCHYVSLQYIDIHHCAVMHATNMTQRVQSHASVQRFAFPITSPDHASLMINYLPDAKLLNFPNSLISIMLKLFARYTSIGIINTLIHWVVFAVCIYIFKTNQALANFSGFVVAVSFSFFANARFTFNSSTTTMRYMLYVGFMGTLSAAVGWEADRVYLPPIATLIFFSAISLVCGFFYSKYIVFRDKK